jgi:adenosylhomocysteine nucleosidase
VHVADAAEKRRLAETYGAKLVDMEAATVARLAQMRGIPMRCFKAVSDGVDADLPDLNPYIDEMGKLRMAGFLGAVALRPQSWGALLQLGRNSSKAANALAEVVGAYLETMSNE